MIEDPGTEPVLGSLITRRDVSVKYDRFGSVISETDSDLITFWMAGEPDDLGGSSGPLTPAADLQGVLQVCGNGHGKGCSIRLNEYQRSQGRASVVRLAR